MLDSSACTDILAIRAACFLTTIRPMERRFGSLTVRIDLTLCVGFGDCVTEAEALFELTDDGAVRFRNDAPAGAPRALLVAACTSCPVDALSLHDEAGVQVAP